MVEDGAFSHKIGYASIFLNLEGHPNCITGSRVTAILMNGRILPFDGAFTGLPRLVLNFYIFVLGFRVYLSLIIIHFHIGI